MSQNQNVQRVDLYQPILAARPGQQPLVVRVGVQNQNSISEGVPSTLGQVRVESYVLLSALPEDLRRRVELAVQALITAI